MYIYLYIYIYIKVSVYLFTYTYRLYTHTHIDICICIHTHSSGCSKIVQAQEEPDGDSMVICSEGQRFRKPFLTLAWHNSSVWRP